MVIKKIKSIHWIMENEMFKWKVKIQACDKSNVTNE